MVEAKFRISGVRFRIYLFNTWKKQELFEVIQESFERHIIAGYRGALIEKVKTSFKIVLEVIKRTELHTFKILPKRWIVERSFLWIDTNRRTAKNYERFNNTGVAVIHLSAIRIMLKHF